MNTEVIALASYVLITTFTPGPNNITSASMGIIYGYTKSLRYLFGISFGFWLVMLFSGWISYTILGILPSFERLLRVVGAGYILWLAFHTMRASYTFQENQAAFWGFSKGFLLQLLNPKVIIYGLALYSTFLVGTATKPVTLFVSSLVFAGVGFCAISTWTLFGAAIRAYLDRPVVKNLLNIILSLMLVFTAIELSGILNILSR